MRGSVAGRAVSVASGPGVDVVCSPSGEDVAATGDGVSCASIGARDEHPARNISDAQSALRNTLCASLIFLAGCSSLAPMLAQLTPSPVAATSSPEGLQTTSTPGPDATETARPATEPRILRVWLPPQFDPNAGTASADLLKQRLADFEAQHPG